MSKVSYPGFFLCLLLLMGLGCSALAQTPLKTVEQVDLTRYLGQWVEIASYPQWFQKGCTATKAEYSLAGPGEIQVTNSCRINDPDQGEIKTAQGLAWVVDQAGNAKLKVQFPLSSWFKLSFLAGDYWIVDLDQDYRFAAVSAPSRKTLWILARQAPLPPGDLQGILERLQAQGFDLTKLVYTKHPSGQAEPSKAAPAAEK